MPVTPPRMLQRHLDGLAIAMSGAVAWGAVVMAGTDECAHGSVREEAELLHQYGLRATDASHAARAYLTAS